MIIKPRPIKTNNMFLSDEIKQIINTQTTKKHMKPAYLTQFDDLRFSNTGNPQPFNQINEEYIELLKINNQIQNTPTFIPHTSKRDTFNSSDKDYNHRKLETFTGTFDNYISKTEKTPLFAPVSNLTWVNGMPAYSQTLKNRYLPSLNNNNGNLPFSNLKKIVKGIKDQNQDAPYAVYHPTVPNIDQLRSNVNQK